LPLQGAPHPEQRGRRVYVVRPQPKRFALAQTERKPDQPSSFHSVILSGPD